MSAHPVSATPVSRAHSAMPKGIPQRFVIRDLLGWAGPALGLKSAVLNTLDVLISFLPPHRDHHVVFASNTTILTRAQGLSERSLRRHIQLLQEAGLLTRQDSPNRKRFIRRATDSALHFGLNLAPLFDKLDLLEELAAQAREDAATRAMLTQQIRCACHQRLNGDSEDALAQEILSQLRRKHDLTQLEDLLRTLSLTPSISVEKNELAVNDGEIDRHHKSLNKDNKIKTENNGEVVTVEDVILACPVATSFCQDIPRSWPQIEEFAETMSAPLGIPKSLYHRAVQAKGTGLVALIIWIMLQRSKDIRHAAAYFASLTCGALATASDPVGFIQRQIRKLSADNRRDDSRQHELHRLAI